MRKDQLHLVANLGCGLTLWASALLLVWWLLPLTWPLKSFVSLVALLLTAYVTHRVLPRLTGPIIDRQSDDVAGD